MEKLHNFLGKLIIVVFFGIIFSSPVFGEEISISGNGAASTNEASVESNQSTQVTQNNDAQITNNIVVQANTGDNSTSSNTGGENTINTGNANVDISVQNTTNNSQVTQTCCSDSNTNLNILENGDESTNNINTSQNNTNNVVVNQTATINNNISGVLNTGGNNGNRNTDGEVTIKTGDIDLKSKVNNYGINFSKISSANGKVDISSIIFGNGADSKNNITSNFDYLSNIFQNNSFSINNNLDWLLTTGNNNADRNTGDGITIETGDIKVIANIDNKVNKNETKTNCCKDQKENDDPETPPSSSPTTPSSGGPSNSGGSVGGSGGSILGITTSNPFLPATGSSLNFWLTLLSLLMFLSGLYLRFHPGNDPSKFTVNFKPAY